MKCCNKSLTLCILIVAGDILSFSSQAVGADELAHPATIENQNNYYTQ
jgi:hypothetical protein